MPANNAKSIEYRKHLAVHRAHEQTYSGLRQST